MLYEFRNSRAILCLSRLYCSQSSQWLSFLMRTITVSTVNGDSVWLSAADRKMRFRRLRYKFITAWPWLRLLQRRPVPRCSFRPLKKGKEKELIISCRTGGRVPPPPPPQVFVLKWPAILHSENEFCGWLTTIGIELAKHCQVPQLPCRLSALFLW